MKRLLMFAGALGLLALATYTPARADVFVDAPSFGRIVYGMTGGAVVLPADAWEGIYPIGAPSPVSAPDSTFGGGAVMVSGQLRYAGDTFGTPGSNTGYDFLGVGGAGAVNATSVDPTLPGVFDANPPYSPATVLSMKLGFISSQGWDSEVSVYTRPSVSPLTSLFGVNSVAGSTNSVSVGSPFGLAYTSALHGFAYYSDDPSNNTGTALNKTINHVKVFQGSGAYANTYFVGFEDWNYDSAGIGHRRFDWNDTVISMEVVPEPAFYQMAGFLGLGAFGLLRLRRRTAK